MASDASGARRRAPERPRTQRYDVGTLAAMLARTLGEEMAADVVRNAARELALKPFDLSAEDALAIFDRLATTDGMVGVAARFAKTRVLLAK